MEVLKIFNSDTGNVYGFYNQGSSSVAIRNVQLSAECPNCTAYGLWNQGGNYFSLEDVHAWTDTTGTAVGVHLDGTTNAFLFNSIIRPGGALEDWGIFATDINGSSLVKIYNSEIGFVDYATEIEGSNTEMNIANSMLAGDILTDSSASYHCIQNFNGNNNPVSCP